MIKGSAFLCWSTHRRFKWEKKVLKKLRRLARVSRAPSWVMIVSLRVHNSEVADWVTRISTAVRARNTVSEISLYTYTQCGIGARWTFVARCALVVYYGNWTRETATERQNCLRSARKWCVAVRTQHWTMVGSKSVDARGESIDGPRLTIDPRNRI